MTNHSDEHGSTRRRHHDQGHGHDGEPASRPTDPQRRYLERGLTQPGGKLPLFSADGREVPPRTIQACLANGWAEPWLANPIKPEWLVCRLTAKGRAALGPAAALPARTTTDKHHRKEHRKHHRNA